MALVGKQRFENVHTNRPPSTSTRRTSRNTSIGRVEVVDRHAARRGVEAAVGERQARIGVQVVDETARGGLVGGQLAIVHPEDRQLGRRGSEVRDPRRHEVEHASRDSEVLVQRPDRGDRPIVDVGHEPVRFVEVVVGRLVGAPEEPGRETMSRRATPSPPEIVACHRATPNDLMKFRRSYAAETS